jgi:hypothetical protein
VGRRAAAVLLVLAAVAAATIVVLLLVRTVIPTISVHGYIAVGIATAGICLLSAGLMALMFHSSRSGWDDIDRED